MQRIICDIVAFLPRDARSAGAVLLSYFVRSSVCNVGDCCYRTGWVSSKVKAMILSCPVSEILQDFY